MRDVRVRTHDQATNKRRHIANCLYIRAKDQRKKGIKEISKAKFENDQITRTTHAKPGCCMYERGQLRLCARRAADRKAGAQEVPRKPGFSVECAKNAKPWFRNSVHAQVILGSEGGGGGAQH